MGLTHLLCVFVSLVFAAGTKHVITSSNLTDLGIWGNFDHCQNSSVVHGFQLKSEGNQNNGDDTALNAIKLFCGNPSESSTQNITSAEGPWGKWGEVYDCFPGVLTGFQLRVEPPLGDYYDDSSTNNVRFFCYRDERDSSAIMEGDGMDWGDWTEVKSCSAKQAICGIQTQVQPDLGPPGKCQPTSLDETALNRIRIECCEYKNWNEVFPNGTRHKVTSTNFTNWGIWGNLERCPGSTAVHGFQLKTEADQGGGDDSALNAIRLFCGDPFEESTPSITSSEGAWGDWGGIHNCYPGVLTGFQLLVEPPRGGYDDSATNNVRFFCSIVNWDLSKYIEGDGMKWGEWTEAKSCPAKHAICGIQTQVQPKGGHREDCQDKSLDETTLNRVRMECCDYNGWKESAQKDDSDAKDERTSSNITSWGTWGKFELCINASAVHAFQLKTEARQGDSDDTALNAIKLFCGDPYDASTKSITSSQGAWGDWGAVQNCFPGVLTGFQLRVDPPQGDNDDTATNNVRFFCNRDKSDTAVFIEGDGLDFGEWTEVKSCEAKQAVCGIQTQVQPYVGAGFVQECQERCDDTSLNRIRVKCCDYETRTESGRASKLAGLSPVGVLTLQIIYFLLYAILKNHGNHPEILELFLNKNV